MAVNTKTMNNQKSLKKNAILNAIRAMMTMIFPLVTFPYASRILLPEGIGKVNFANSIIDYFVIIADLGITTYAAREAARIRDNKIELSKFCREIMIINFISTAISFLLFIVAILFISKFQNYKILLIVCASKILFSTIGIGWLYTAEEEFLYITTRTIFFQIISIIFLFTFVHSKEDYIFYAGMGVFSSVGSNILNFTYSKKFINLFEKTKIELKKHILPIFILFGNRCASVINNTIDSIMLGFLLGDTSVGLYAASIKITKIVISLVDSVIGTILPRSAYYLENNNIKKYSDLKDKAFSASIFFSIPITAGLFILSKQIILLFSGKEYLPAVNAAKIITLMVIPIAGSYIINTSILIPSRKEKITFTTQMIGLFSNILLNSILVPFFGLIGACFATVLVEYSIFISRLIFTWKIIPKKECIINISQSISSSFVMSIVITFLLSIIKKTIIQIISSIIIGILTYFSLMALLKNKTALALFSILIKHFKTAKSNKHILLE